jgi:adenosylcobinamide-phosphate synthase
VSERGLTLLLSLLLDQWLSEPPNRWHPVAWLGSGLDRLERQAPRQPPGLALGLGIGLAGLAGLGSGLVGFGLERSLDRLPWPLRVALGALTLKPALSLRALADEATGVGWALAAGRLDPARTKLRALVSRETGQLAEAQVASAAIESLAENLSDSVVAPGLFYLVGGLPAAFAYRAANTLDAMIGYHGEYEQLGKAAARLDDLLNLLPARLSALLLLAAAWLGAGDGRRAWRTLGRDHGQTASPNAGWPMSAAAGALGRRLEKVDHYILGAEFAEPGAGDVRRAVRLYYGTVGFALALLLAGQAAWLWGRDRPAPAS